MDWEAVMVISVVNLILFTVIRGELREFISEVRCWKNESFKE